MLQAWLICKRQFQAQNKISLPLHLTSESMKSSNDAETVLIPLQPEKFNRLTLSKLSQVPAVHRPRRFHACCLPMVSLPFAVDCVCTQSLFSPEVTGDTLA